MSDIFLQISLRSLYVAFSYPIRYWVRSTHTVETGREELKKEREIMQLVAGLQLNSDEVERREVPPHMLRARHGPR
ncbi:unnamed protein product [Euphydryas editha]|uniref:Uncharacterized protein n=1 Tax=Euphydryas editha TaxID=104508 RepID=A0AAU9U4V9_EUPED|nr:unnamed protein product [Euphydryas editha]